MGYVDENLISDEVVMYRAQLHWATLILPAIVAAFFGLLGVLLLVWAAGTEDNSGGTLAVVAIVLIVLGAIPLIGALMKKAAAEFAVTNKRVIFKTGVIRRKTAEMFLNKIESVGVDQTIGGRIFSYGSIVLHGTGGSTEPFVMIGHPLELRRQVQEQIGKSTKNGMTSGASSG